MEGGRLNGWTPSNGLDTYCSSLSLTRGSNLGPPGMARLRALAVKKDLRSNK